jgi:membrane protein YqaA with SNARE-associated domain
MKPTDDLRSITVSTIKAALIFLAGYTLIAVLFRRQLAQAGLWMGENLGYAGVWLYTFLVDTFIVPATADIVFPFIVDWNPYIVLPGMGAASMLGGICGYWIARSFTHLRFVGIVTAAYRSRGEALIRRYGVWAVVLAGLTPIPYSTICWITGLLKVPAVLVAAAGLSRIPRMIIYFLLFKGGLSLASLISG